MVAFGQTLSAGDTVFSPWFPRQAANCVFRCELIDENGSATLKVWLFHKNTEDTGDGAEVNGTPATPDISLSTAGNIGEASMTKLKQLVRIKYEVTGDTGDNVRFRMLTPAWYDANKV